jgi:geranylgeranyl pyrophosphate synthase
MKLQPNRKSLGNYIRLGFEYASGKNFGKNSLSALEKINLIDDAVLIIDDILDNSKIRNGKPCLYIQEGIQSAIIKAELNNVKAVENLIKVMKINRTKDSFQKKVLEKFFELLKNIYLGQKLDLELYKFRGSNKDVFKNYTLII